MRIWRKSASGVAALAAGAVALAGCASGSTASGSTTGDPLAGQTITVYNGQHPQTMDALVKDFERRSGVTLRVRAGEESELANQILQEGSASPADVFVAENPPALTVLQEKGLLAAVRPSTLAAVPRTDSSPRGDWVGVSLRSAVLVYNTGRMASGQVPTSIKDLAGPVWRGALGIAPTETDFTPIVTLMIKAYGMAATTAWLKGLKANAKVYASDEDLVAAVNRGEVTAGVIEDHYWYRLRDELGAGAMHSALGYFRAGDPGAMVDVSGAAVLASSQHKAAAQAFLAYLVSAPAQRIIATSESYEYPLAAGVTTTRLARTLAQVGPAVPAGDLGDGRQALRLMQNLGLL